MQASIRFIGAIQSSLKKIEDCPLQENESAPEATVVIYPEFIDGIKDIKAGSEIVLLTWLHLADRSVIQCVSRNNYDSPKLGVFSTRSPDRPNPIGIHTAKVLSVSYQGTIKLSGLEVLDGTPLIDIKPVWNNSR
jgi:tRNA-Thr(GGU) m(6)t(6)A37 methyltransferase TsaA